jgi:hypothetical protein
VSSDVVRSNGVVIYYIFCNLYMCMLLEFGKPTSVKVNGDFLL